MDLSHVYETTPVIAGELCDLYRCTCGETILKSPREDEADEALMNEAFALSVLINKTEDKRMLPFVPEPMEIGGVNHVFRRLDGFYTLEQVREKKGVLDPRDMAWMFRRLLVVLGFASRAEIVHGAVVPSHVMIHPEKHGLVLVDWCYARTERDSVLLRTSEKYADWYPVEVQDEAPVGPATDLDMAARCMIWLIGGDPVTATVPDDMPRPYRPYFAALNRREYAGRVEDAWEAKTYFEQLIERLYGPRRFRPFSMAD